MLFVKVPVLRWNDTLKVDEPSEMIINVDHVITVEPDGTMIDKCHIWTIGDCMIEAEISPEGLQARIRQAMQKDFLHTIYSDSRKSKN